MKLRGVTLTLVVPEGEAQVPHSFGAQRELEALVFLRLIAIHSTQSLNHLRSKVKTRHMPDSRSAAAGNRSHDLQLLPSAQ